MPVRFSPTSPPTSCVIPREPRRSLWIEMQRILLSAVMPGPLLGLHPQGLLTRHVTPLAALRSHYPRTWVSAVSMRICPAQPDHGSRVGTWEPEGHPGRSTDLEFQLCKPGLHASAESGHLVISQHLFHPSFLEFNFHQMS